NPDKCGVTNHAGSWCGQVESTAYFNLFGDVLRRTAATSWQDRCGAPSHSSSERHDVATEPAWRAEYAATTGTRRLRCRRWTSCVSKCGCRCLAQSVVARHQA